MSVFCIPYVLFCDAGPSLWIIWNTFKILYAIRVYLACVFTNYFHFSFVFSHHVAYYATFLSSSPCWYNFCVSMLVISFHYTTKSSQAISCVNVELASDVSENVCLQHHGLVWRVFRTQDALRPDPRTVSGLFIKQWRTVNTCGVSLFRFLFSAVKREQKCRYVQSATHVLRRQDLSVSCPACRQPS